MKFCKNDRSRASVRATSRWLTTIVSLLLAASPAAAEESPTAGKELASATMKPAAAVKLVNFTRGAVHDLNVDDSGVHVRIPITLADNVTEKDLEVEIVDATFDLPIEPASTNVPANPSAPAASGAPIEPVSSPSKPASAAPAKPRLVLTDKAMSLALDAAYVSKPGPYSIVLAVAKKGEPKAVQRCELQLTYPKASLHAPTTVVIRRVIGLFNDVETVTPEIPLRETSRRAPLWPLKLVQSDNTTHDDGATGPLKFKGPFKVRPGDIEWASYELAKDYPLGTVRGEIEAQAPQLESVQTVNFEVRTRRTHVWIWITAALGLVVGWALRFPLKEITEKNRRRVRLADALQRLADAEMRFPDTDFAEKLRPARKKLRGALDDESADADAVIKEAQSTFEQASTDLDARRAALGTSLATAVTLTQDDDDLPPALQDALSSARGRLDGVVAHRERDAVRQGNDLLERIRADLGRALRFDADLLGKRIDGALGALRDLAAPLGDTLCSEVDTTWNEIRASLAETAARDAAQLLKAARAARVKLRSTVVHAANAAERLVETVAESVSAAAADAALLALVSEARAAIEGAVDEAAEKPEEAIQELPKTIKRLLVALEALLQSRRDKLAAKDRKDFDEALAAQRYDEAARIIAAAKSTPEEDDEILGDVENPEVLLFGARARGLDGKVFALNNPIIAAPRSPRPAARGAAPSEKPIWLVRTESQKASTLAAWATRVLSGVVILFAGYAALAERFVGTPADFATVFFWAFALNASVEVASEVGKATQKPT